MEKSISVDQRQLRLNAFLTAHAHQLRRQGAVIASYRRRGLRRLGPYYRLTYRDDQGRQRALYLGTDLLLVQRARDELQALQQFDRLRRVLRRARRAVRRAARRARDKDQASLAAWGLGYRGRELRGPWQAALASQHGAESATESAECSVVANHEDGGTHDAT